MKKIIGVTALILLTIGTNSCLDNGGSESQLQKDVKIIDKYLQDTGILANEYVIVDASGIRIVINSFGINTPPPHSGQNVKITYEGKLFADGTSFDFNILDKKIDDVIPSGLAYGVSGMLGGTSASIYVPSTYGFGASGTSTLSGNVPGNAILVYNVVLNDVVKSESEKIQFTTDTTAIESYITDHTIENVIKHASGIRYVITESGSDDSPRVYDNVTFKYVLKLLKTDGDPVKVDEGTITNTYIFGSLIDGMKIGLALLQEGDKATMYMPSGICYGTKPTSAIPANSNLIFEVELVEVFPRQ